MKPFLPAVYAMLLTCVTNYCLATYNVTTNANWTTVTASSTNCVNCSFIIHPGVTLTLNLSGVTCSSCTFTGGHIQFNKDFICQDCSFTGDTMVMPGTTLTLPTVLGTTTSLSGDYFSLTGAGAIYISSNVAISNSNFDLYNTSSFTNAGGTLTMSNSHILMANNAFFLANAGPVNVGNHSNIIAGDATLASAAYIDMEVGNALNIDGTSFLGLANSSNYLYDWSSYNSTGNGMTYNTSSNAFNCGGGHPHACQAPYMYGCATINDVGPLSCTVLATGVTQFTAVEENESSVRLSWTIQGQNGVKSFTIQRSTDGQTFQDIAVVDTVGVLAASDEYAYTDLYPLHGNNSYRLKILAGDESVIYSNIVAAQVSTDRPGINIWPNPVVDHWFYLQTASGDPVMLQIYTLEGQERWSVTLTGQRTYKVRLPAYIPSNQYLIVKLTSAGITKSVLVFNQ